MRELRDVRGLHPSDLSGRQRLLVAFAAGLVTVVLVLTVIYNWGMATLEGRPQSIFRSFQTVVETMTTTGFGADSPWATPVMNVLMVAIQFTGVVIGFVTLRILVIPLFERTPLNLDDRLSAKNDHVVIAEYRRDTDVLLDELEQFDVEYVLVESDEEEAKRLSDDGYQAINGDPEQRRDLDRAAIERANVLITDAGDRTASVVLTALEANEDLRVISFTESTRRQEALREVGVDRAVAPHALIGQRLAEKATLPVTVETDDEGSAPFEIREILIRRDSPLHGVSLAESPIANHPQLMLVAGWFDGDLRFSPSGADQLTPNTVLLVAGPGSSIDDLIEEIAGVRGRKSRRYTDVIVAGLGEGGAAARDALSDDVSVTTIDANADAGADIVGDVTEPATLREAGIETASALLVTVDDDSAALLTIALARSISSDVEILVRVTDAEKVRPAFGAGADYVLSIQRVSARLVAAEVHGERVMDPTNQIRLVRIEGSAFAGDSLSAVRKATREAWNVVGVSRGGGVHTDGATVVEDDDEVFVAGSDTAIQALEESIDRSQR